MSPAPKRPPAPPALGCRAGRGGGAAVRAAGPGCGKSPAQHVALCAVWQGHQEDRQQFIHVFWGGLQNKGHAHAALCDPQFPFNLPKKGVL